MSTTVLDRPGHSANRPSQRDSGLTGVLGLLRLYLRRDRIVLPLWMLLLSVPLASVYIASIEKIYPNQAERAEFAASIMASPAQRALYGPVYNDTLGAVGVWKAGMFHLLIAIAVILTMIRHTRGDEESGRTELIDSTVVGWYAGLTAALLLSFGASIATGAIGVAGLLATDVPVTGSLAFGAALACSGLIAERPGASRAAPALAGVFGLAWRLDRGALLLWTVGVCLYGLLIGSVAHGIGDELGGSTAARDIVARLGDSSALEQAFIAVAFAMLGMVTAAFAVSLTLRVHQEETTGHAETLLAGAVSRTRWLASHLVIAVTGSAAALLLAGLAVGVSYGITAGDVGAKLPVVLDSAAVQLPAVWLLAALTVALFGVLPRFTPVIWGVLVGFIALYLLGSLSGFPQWLLNMEPFGHIPLVEAGEFQGAALVWLLVIDTVLITFGLLAFRHRDIRC